MEKRPTVIRKDKVATVEQIQENLGRATMTILADYRGLNVTQLSELRRQLRPTDAELRVVKNTLARLAAQRSGSEALLPVLVGPTAIAFSYGDPAAMAKALTDTIRTQRLPMQIKGALLGSRLVPAADVLRIADLPSREVVLAHVVGAVQAPISSFVGTLAGVLQSFIGLLEARREQLEGSANQ